VIEAAASRPHLTSRANQVGGLGLKTIRELVCQRGGSLTILSLDAKVRWSGSEIFRQKKVPRFRGTGIEIEFRPDAMPSGAVRPPGEPYPEDANWIF
jgi:hypothetical protein